MLPVSKSTPGRQTRLLNSLSDTDCMYKYVQALIVCVNELIISGPESGTSKLCKIVMVSILPRPGYIVSHSRNLPVF